MELDLLGGIRQVSLDKGIVEQLGQTFQDKAQVLIKGKKNFKHPTASTSFTC